MLTPQSTSWEANIQIYEPMGIIAIQITINKKANSWVHDKQAK